MNPTTVPPPVNGHARPVTLTPMPMPGVTPPDDPGQPQTAVGKPGRWRGAMSAASAHRAWLAAVPVILVNAVAFAGQLAFLRVHLPWVLAGQVLVAVTLESVAVYLAWQAHLALTAGDSALRLRLAAYSFAAVIGVMNYSHYMAAGWRPTFAAVTFGLMSVSSPWLWSVHSRRVSRDALLAAGDLDAHAVRLGATRWLWHGYRSVRVMRAATWAGEANPARAIALVYPPGDVAGGAAGQPGEDGGEGLAGSLPVRAAAVAAPPVTPAVTPARGDRPPSGKVLTKQERAAAVIRDNPGLTNAELAALAGCDTRTIQRAKNSTEKAP